MTGVQTCALPIVVAGAAYGDNFHVHHVIIEDVDQLSKLQGSKYVQSDTENIYREIKSYLQQDRKVLFSGTPCQVSALNHYLKKDYANLLTVDLLCHGVPSNKMFRESLDYLGNGKCSIDRIVFRDKFKGWGTSGSRYIGNKRYPFDQTRSAYYYYYLADSLSRDSCYQCRFAAPKRAGDITFGDYWKIETAHPEEFSRFDPTKGISCVMVNTEKGMMFFEEVEQLILSIHSEASLVEERNNRMRWCEPEPKLRLRIMQTYEENGWAGVNKLWQKTTLKKRIILIMKGLLPCKVKFWIKKSLNCRCKR